MIRRLRNNFVLSVFANVQVLNVELQAIRAACTKLEAGYKPAVTFLVVQKRHHTRFFPGPADWDGPKNKNVMAGTLVDTGITHPTEVDFYLVSHQSIQVSWKRIDDFEKVECNLISYFRFFFLIFRVPLDQRSTICYGMIIISHKTSSSS